MQLKRCSASACKPISVQYILTRCANVAAHFAAALAIFTEMVRTWRQELLDRESAFAAGLPTPGSQTPRAKAANSVVSMRSPRVDHYYRRSLELEEELGHRFDTVMPLLRVAATPLLDACCAALGGVRNVLDAQNATRWSEGWSKIGRERIRAAEETQRAKLVALREALALYESTTRFGVLAPWEGIMNEPIRDDPINGLQGAAGQLPFSLRPLYFVFSFQSSILAFARNEVVMMEVYEKLWAKRTANR